MAKRNRRVHPFEPIGYLALFWTVLSLSSSAGPALAGNEIVRLPSSPGAVVYIISPADGDTVTSPVTIRFGLKGMGIAPAGIEMPKTGHHHLLIDSQAPDLSLPVPADAKHIHYGGGQTEATLELEPGPHTLRLLLGDYRHVPHAPPVISEQINIRVQ